jgi:hypothetical protein
VADVDAELEGRRGNDCAQAPGFEPPLRVEPRFLCQAAVVRRDRVGAESVAQVPRDAFGHAPGIHEHERCAVGLD